MTDQPQKKRSAMEKYAAQTIQGLILAILLGVGSLVSTQNQTINTVNTNVAVLQLQVKQLSDSQSTYLTKSDADQRGKIRDMQIETIKSDLTGVKSDIIDLKKVFTKTR